MQFEYQKHQPLPTVHFHSRTTTLQFYGHTNNKLLLIYNNNTLSSKHSY